MAAPACASDRSEAEMASIAAAQLFGASARGVGQDAGVECVMSGSELGIYRNSSGPGFVVVSRDDAFSPVLGYSSGEYVADELPDGLRWWLGEMERSLAWRKANGMMVQEVEFTPVENFVASTWGQTSPYNYLCPKDGTTQAPTGCVATAMAQIMYYYKYPEHSVGYGSHSVGENGKTVKDTLGATYEWDKLLNSYTKPIYPAATKERIGRLMFDCGAAVNMNYTASFSGSTSIDAGQAMYSNFQYDSLSVQHIMRIFYTDNEWMTVVYEELAARRPVFYTGVDNSLYGGHAFLASGIDESGKIYINWGWNGTGDGFYDMSELAPTGILGYDGKIDFSSNQTIVIGMKPQLEPDEGEEIIPHIYNYSANYQLTSTVNNRIKVNPKDIYNMGLHDFRGTLNLYLFEESNESNRYTFNAYTTPSTMKELSSTSGDYPSSRTIDVSSLPAGTWVAYLGALQEGGTRVMPVRGLGGARFFTVTKDDNGRIAIKSRGIKEVTMGIQQPTVAAQQDNGTTNGIFDLSGRKLNSVPSKGIYIENGKKHLQR